MIASKPGLGGVGEDLGEGQRPVQRQPVDRSLGPSGLEVSSAQCAGVEPLPSSCDLDGQAGELGVAALPLELRGREALQP